VLRYALLLIILYRSLHAMLSVSVVIDTVFTLLQVLPYIPVTQHLVSAEQSSNQLSITLCCNTQQS
jgi:hypothetical protein